MNQTSGTTSAGHAYARTPMMYVVDHAGTVHATTCDAMGEAGAFLTRDEALFTSGYFCACAS